MENFQIETNSTFGRYLTASTFLKEGSLVLQEDALFSAPNGKFGGSLCLGCNTGFGNDNEIAIPCSGCCFYLHTKCEAILENNVHKENECQIFKSAGISPRSNEDDIYNKILILRGCLLKLRNVKKWRQILQLESHIDKILATCGGKLLTKGIVEFILNRCKLSEYVSSFEVCHVLGGVLTNAYVFASSSPPSSCGSFVFYTGSMPAHSCQPNCKWSINSRNQLEIYTLTDIPKGSSLTHSYVWTETGTLERQRILLASKYFLCSCPRCQDPTELGSYISALRCRNRECRKGWMLSDNPLDLGSPWSCSYCFFTIREKDVEYVLEKMKDMHYNCVENILSASPSTDRDWENTLTRLEACRKKMVEEIAHPNHFIVLEVEMDILHRIRYVFEKGLERDVQVQSRLSNLEVDLSRRRAEILNKITRPEVKPKDNL